MFEPMGQSARLKGNVQEPEGSVSHARKLGARSRLLLAVLALAGGVGAAPVPGFGLGEWRSQDLTRFRRDMREAARRRSESVARQRRDAARARREAGLAAQEMRREARQLVAERRAAARRAQAEWRNSMRELRQS